MIKPELYHKTVGILFDAYFNDTLVHWNGCGCAVGNIIAANMNLKVINPPNKSVQWSDGTTAEKVAWNKVINLGEYRPERLNDVAQKQFDSTGYSMQEILMIEHAFESCEYTRDKEDFMYNGLCAVLDCLAHIHQVTDQDLLTSNNKRFKEQYEKRIAV